MIRAITLDNNVLIASQCEENSTRELSRALEPINFIA